MYRMDKKSFYEKDFFNIRVKVNELRNLVPDGLEKSNLLILSFIINFQRLNYPIKFFEDIKNRRGLNGKLNDICDYSYLMVPYNPVCFDLMLDTAYQADMKRFHWLLINYSKSNNFLKRIWSMRNPVIFCNPVDKQIVINLISQGKLP